MNSKQFSVSMSVYKNDDISDFTAAVLSVYNQTCRPNEIILVIDGPISQAMQSTIKMLEEKTGIMKIIPLGQNMGHAIARQTGLEHSSNNLVAIMDSDDISVPNRFEMTLKAFEQHPDVTVVGGNISEFIDDVSNVVGNRIVPEHDEEIKNYLKSRCPMNLVTVMYRKDKVQEVGGFMDWYCNEDYYLWVRLALAGKRFYNLQKKLVDVRVGKEMYQRRGGWKYFKSEARLQKYMWDNHLIGLLKYIYNLFIRFFVQVAMPNSLRGYFFRIFARK